MYETPTATFAHSHGVAGDGIVVLMEPSPDSDTRLHFTLIAAQPVPLRRMLPALQSMDLEVLHEQTDPTLRDDGSIGYGYRLTLQAGVHAAAVVAVWSPAAETRIRETFQAIWSGRAEADQFNTLVLSAGLSWQDVAVLRSYSRYFRQISLPYGQALVQRVLLDNPDATQAIMALFAARFSDTGRGPDHPERLTRMASAATELDARIDAAAHIDTDRVLRAYRSLITATVRTNAYAPEALTALAPYLVHKIRAREVDEIPEPRPLSEIIVSSPDFEGLHLRHALVARGGLRWSDRVDDYRTEVLGLVKAQAVKNAVIVPSGAKGVFVIKRHPGVVGESVDAHTRQTSGRRCYRQFISALLDVVDLTAPGVADVPRAGVVCHDGADHYMVVAADKGTATFSDTANAIALERGYWLGDAFASGGSTGFDHKAMGITARGAWVSGDAHLRELGVDTNTDEFTAVGVGDMSGDVFGNGMLLRPNVRLIAAFDHRHVFIDPCPPRERAFEERQRLFGLPQSSWADYDRSVISSGGGVWSRTAKSITLTAQIREALGLNESVTTVTPHDLISHVLRAPVDLLWNGGVGTYVKASDESHADVGDKANDLLRVDAREIRSRVIVEGGNLGVSPRGRIEYAEHGGLINADAIDNAAGVDCSDHEVEHQDRRRFARQDAPRPGIESHRSACQPHRPRRGVGACQQPRSHPDSLGLEVQRVEVRGRPRAHDRRAREAARGESQAREPAHQRRVLEPAQGRQRTVHATARDPLGAREARLEGGSAVGRADRRIALHRDAGPLLPGSIARRAGGPILDHPLVARSSRPRPSTTSWRHPA